MSRWDIFRWRTLAGGPPCRQGRQRFSHQAFLSPRPKRVPPFGISDGGGHGIVRGAGELPSQSPSGDSSPKGGAKSRLPPWGRWTRVSEDGEGKLPASPSAPVAIALTGASAPVAGFFLAARP